MKYEVFTNVFKINNIMSKTIKFMLVLFLFLGSYANAQFIIAGQHVVNDYYYKYTPDSTVISIPGNNLGYDSLDINNDGIMDFQFALLAPNGPDGPLGENEDYCTIRGLNNNKVAFGTYDTCFNCGNGYANSYIMAKVFRYNDTINSKANWDSLVYLNYYFRLGLGACQGPGDSSSFNCGSLSWSDTTYIGVRIQIGSTFEYGWIKIVGENFSSNSTLTMGEFACEKGNVGIEQLSSQQVTIYPNPAKNRLQVIAGRDNVLLTRIYDLQGKEMICTKGKEIDVSNLKEGIYFARIKTSEGIFAKKIIIQR